MRAIETIHLGNLLGECVLWNHETQSVWWTDIEGRRLHRLDWECRRLRVFPTPERLCSFGFVAGEERVIAAFESGLALYDPENGEGTWLWRLNRPGQRMNDGRVDREGRFWAGAMAEDRDQAGRAELYCLEADGSVLIRERGISISNSIAWSPDGVAFYFADSPARTIWRYAFSNGRIADRDVFARTPEGVFPDGATVDAEGFLWSAQWGGGRVVRYAPDGGIARELELPVSQPTCVALGGPDLDLLFVTSARAGLSEAALTAQAGAGDLFVYNADVAGLPEHRFVGPCGPGGTPWRGPMARI